MGFFVTIIFELFLGTFWGGLDFFDPLNCLELKNNSHKKTIMSQIFLNSGTLVILCPFATMGSQFYSFWQFFDYFFDNFLSV